MRSEQIKVIIALQDKMNCHVYPDWREKGFEWTRAAYLEMAEAIEHHGWKWWKKQVPDISQVKMELVDILHFQISDDITKFPQAEIIERVSSAYDAAVAKKSDKGFLTLADEVVKSLSGGVVDWEMFFEASLSIDLEFDEMFLMYLGKNVLNTFRQDHGYKEGTYVKIWNGKEDNEYLTSVLDAVGGDVDPVDVSDWIYSKLEEGYLAATA